MRDLRRYLVWGCILVVAGSAWAQAPVKPDAVRKPLVLLPIEPILTRIPAGSAAFVVVRNLDQAAKNVRKFAEAIGTGEMLPEGLIEMGLEAAKVGEGFNANGGIASVLLDPAKFDVDLMKLIASGGRPPKAEEGKPPPPEPKIPLVIFVPGKGVASVLANYKPEPAGKFMKIMAPMGPVFARQSGGYILISPSQKAVEAVMASKKPVQAGLSAQQGAILKKSDVGVYLNMSVMGPLLNKGMDMAQGAMPRGKAMPVDIGKFFGFYKAIIAQVKDVVLTVRVDAKAVVLDKAVTFKPDSKLGKALAAIKPGKGALLNRLPNLPYVLASSQQSTGADKDLYRSLIDLFMPLMNSLLKDDEAKVNQFKKLAEGLIDQIDTEQFVAGGAPKGSGLFGAAVVWQCKDAAKTKALMVDYINLVRDMIVGLVPERDKEDASQLKFVHTKGAETIGGVAVDTVEVAHPELGKLSEDERAQMKNVLGEDKIRLFLASVDPKTLVMTFGGSKAFLAEALKAARGGGTIPADKNVQAVLKALPKNPSTVILVSGANLWKVVLNGFKVMDEEPPPIQITAPTPVAIGGGVDGAGVHGTLYVPSDLVKDIVGAVMSMTAARDDRRGAKSDEPEPPKGEDF